MIKTDTEKMCIRDRLKRERYRNMVKRINDLPDDKQMFVIGIINGMLLTEETKNETKMAEKAG